jgi:hypothetical protein
VSFVKGDPEREELLLPAEAEIARQVRADLGRWSPRRGPDFTEVMARAGIRVNTWIFYPAMSAVLVTILLIAFLVMTSLHVGPLGAQPVHSQIVP